MIFRGDKNRLVIVKIARTLIHSSVFHCVMSALDRHSWGVKCVARIYWAFDDNIQRVKDLMK